MIFSDFEKRLANVSIFFANKVKSFFKFRENHGHSMLVSSDLEKKYQPNTLQCLIAIGELICSIQPRTSRPAPKVVAFGIGNPYAFSRWP